MDRREQTGSSSEGEGLAEGGLEETGTFLAHLVGLAGPMIGPRDDVELELVFLACGQQGVAEIVAASHVDVGVGFTDGKEESPAEVGGVTRAGVLIVPRPDRVA